MPTQPFSFSLAGKCWVRCVGKCEWNLQLQPAGRSCQTCSLPHNAIVVPPEGTREEDAHPWWRYLLRPLWSRVCPSFLCLTFHLFMFPLAAQVQTCPPVFFIPRPPSRCHLLKMVPVCEWAPYQHLQPSPELHEDSWFLNVKISKMEPIFLPFPNFSVATIPQSSRL